MNNLLLQQQPSWRYCRVRDGEKKPYPANWQNNPLTLKQVDSNNIGLMLGPIGNGICAIDFDGTSAWAWLESKGIDYKNLPMTPTWTSGKTDRCQMAFNVPNDIWDYVRTIKMNKSKDPIFQDNEGFEFRWAGGQSVLPPSIHPDTKQPYAWIIEPNIICADLPVNLLELWVKYSEYTVKDTIFSEEIKIDDLDENTIHDIDKVLEALKNRHISLSYDDWMKVTFATAHHIGREAASVMLPKFYPEQKQGEYRYLLRTWNPSKSPTIGTLLFMAGLKKDPEIQQAITGNLAATKFLNEQRKYKKLL
jgi:hypothetical protein